MGAMRRMSARALMGAMALLWVSACAGGQVWYEERCSSLGFKTGTAEFVQCLQREKAWIEPTSRRAQYDSRGDAP